jgi:hypothetical protein
MEIARESSLADVARAVCTALHDIGITVVLTGGSAATLYAPDAYQSEDIDFVAVEIRSPEGGSAEACLAELGYRRERDHYRHATNPYPIEFPPGPLAVGGELVSEWNTQRRGRTVLNVLTATDSCKDRLAAFFHWNDRAGLAQALAVAWAAGDGIDFPRLARWAESEGAAEKYIEFERRLGRGR